MFSLNLLFGDLCCVISLVCKCSLFIAYDNTPYFYLPVCISFTKRSHNKQHVALHLNINGVILIRTSAGIQKDSCKIFTYVIELHRQVKEKN